MYSYLCFDIYGVRLKIIFKKSGIEDLKKLFFPFLVECEEEGKFHKLDFEPKSSPTEIAPMINPIFAKKGIWGFHGAGVIYKKRALVFLGKSGAGKSTLTRIFLSLGLKIIGDDIILMKDTEEGIDVLPLFHGIQEKDKSSIKPIHYSNFSAGNLSKIFILSGIRDKTKISGPISSTLLKKEIYKNMLWGLDKDTIKKQLAFVEKLILNPAYYMILGHDILKEEELLIYNIEQIAT